MMFGVSSNSVIYAMTGHKPAQDDRSGNRMRIIDVVAAAYLHPTASATYAQPHPNYSTLQRPVLSHTDGRHYVAWQPQSTPIATLQGYVATYHDPRSMQRTHNYGQTDTSAYNSPWTPTQQDTQMGVHTPAMLATSQPHSMSYAQPLHPPIDSQQHSFESGPPPSYPSSLQTFDVGNFGTAHELKLQPNRQAREAPSNMHFEGASMHLKMRSLPILESLVSGSRLVTPRSRLQPEKCSVCASQRLESHDLRSSNEIKLHLRSMARTDADSQCRRLRMFIKTGRSIHAISSMNESKPHFSFISHARYKQLPVPFDWKRWLSSVQVFVDIWLNHCESIETSQALVAEQTPTRRLSLADVHV